MNMLNLSIPDMSCGHCKQAIEKAIAALDSAATVNIDLKNRQATVTSNSEPEQVLSCLKEAGYEASVIGDRAA